MEDQDKIAIPDVVYEGDDKRLKERVFKFRQGSLRIAIFTVMGFIMGGLSHHYTSITFFPVKLLIAVPYKISEAIYVFMIGTDGAGARNVFPHLSRWYLGFTEFFPHSRIATFLAENFTAFLIGGALYGALAYFTGDKRVFTLQRFLEFATVWCGMILIAVGSAYLVNARAVYDNENLRGDVSYMFLYTSDGSGGGISGEETRTLMQEYLHSGLEPGEAVRDYDGEKVVLVIEYDNVREHSYRINYEAQYLATEQGKVYHISERFAQLIRRMDQEGDVRGILDGERAEVIEKPSPEAADGGNTREEGGMAQ